MENMNVVWRSTDDLIPYERNQKKHDDTQVKNVANSIKRFGWTSPIVIDAKDVVVIGHCRLMAAKRLGLDKVPTLCVDNLTEDEVRELRIVDNKTNESPWDFASLDIDTMELSFEGFDFGFNTASGAPDSFDDFFTEAEPKEKEPKKIQCPHCGEWIEV